MQHTVRMRFQNWRIDADGFLRVTARVLREGVFPYAKADLPPEIQNTFHPDQVSIHQYIPAVEFTADALSSLEGKPVVIIDHEWRDPENTTRDGLTVGNVAGAPYVEDGGILVDLLITEHDTIEKITSKELVEVSSGYDGDLIMETGAFGDQAYDAVQTNLRFNHILLLPVGEGRCGYEVRIINKKETIIMAELVHVRIGNREYKFSNAEDAEEAKKMSKDEASEATGGFDMEKVKNAMEELPKLQEQVTEHKKVIEELKATISKLEDPEAQEAAALELVEQAQNEEAIMATEVEEKDREQVCNAMKACCNRKDRAKVLMTHVLNAKGMDPASLDDAAVNTLFRFHALNSRKALEAAEKEAEEARKRGVVVGAHLANRGEAGALNKFFAARFGNKGGK